MAFKQREPNTMYEGEIIVFRHETYEHFQLGRIEKVISEHAATISYWSLADNGFQIFHKMVIIGAHPKANAFVELFNPAKHGAIKDALIAGWHAMNKAG